MLFEIKDEFVEEVKRISMIRNPAYEELASAALNFLDAIREDQRLGLVTVLE